MSGAWVDDGPNLSSESIISSGGAHPDLCPFLIFRLLQLPLRPKKEEALAPSSRFPETERRGERTIFFRQINPANWGLANDPAFKDSANCNDGGDGRISSVEILPLN